jgi:hypothetical protein
MTSAGIAVIVGVALLGGIAVIFPRALFGFSLKLSSNRSPEPNRRTIRTVRICGAIVALISICLIFADQMRN